MNRELNADNKKFTDISHKFILPAPKEMDNGFLGNMGALAVGGAKRLLKMSGVGPDNAAETIASELTTTHQQPKELKEAQESFLHYDAQWKNAKNRAEKVGIAMKMMGTLAKEAVTNHKGAAYLMAEQAANMAPPIALMIAGGKLGLLGGPYAPFTVPAGAAAGLFTGTKHIEQSLEVVGFIDEALKERGMTPTTANVQKILDDPEAYAEVSEKTRAKANTTALVDLLFMGVSARLLRNATGNAAKVAARTGRPVVAPSLASRAAHGVGAIGLDTVGEGVSDASGRVAATGDFAPSEVAMEMFGGLGGSIVEVPTAARILAGAAKKRVMDTKLKDDPTAHPGPTAPEKTSAPVSKEVVADFTAAMKSGKLSETEAFAAKRLLSEKDPRVEDSLTAAIIEAGEKGYFKKSKESRNLPIEDTVEDVPAFEPVDEQVSPEDQEVAALKKSLAEQAHFLDKNAAYKGAPIYDTWLAKYEADNARLAELTGQKPAEPITETMEDTTTPEIVEPAASSQEIAGTQAEQVVQAPIEETNVPVQSLPAAPKPPGAGKLEATENETRQEKLSLTNIANAIRTPPPIVKDGFVRVYRGESSDSNDPQRHDSGRFWTRSLNEASSYGDRLWYLDIPADQAGEPGDVLLANHELERTGAKLLDHGYYDIPEKIRDKVFGLLEDGKKAEAIALIKHEDSISGKVEAAVPSEIFIRPAVKSDLGSASKSLAAIPDKEGYDKVYKPVGRMGRGFYYVKKAEVPTPEVQKAKVKKAKQRRVKLDVEKRNAENAKLREALSITSEPDTLDFVLTEMAEDLRRGEAGGLMGTDAAGDNVYAKSGHVGWYRDLAKSLDKRNREAKKAGRAQLPVDKNYFINVINKARNGEELTRKQTEAWELLNQIADRESSGHYQKLVAEYQKAREAENEQASQRAERDEEEGIDAEAISNSQERLEEVSVSEIAEAESLSEAEIDAALLDCDDFFSAVGKTLQPKNDESIIETKEATNNELESIGKTELEAVDAGSESSPGSAGERFVSNLEGSLENEGFVAPEGISKAIIEAQSIKNYLDSNPDRRFDAALRKELEGLSHNEVLDLLAKKHEALKTDPITGLKSKAAYENSEKLPYQASIDLDGLKFINDTYGHEAGDAWIKKFGSALGRASNNVEAYRVGGDEFVLQGQTAAELTTIVNKTKAILKNEPLEFGGQQFTISFSNGIATSFKEADAAMFEDKKARKSVRGEKPKEEITEKNQTKIEGTDSFNLVNPETDMSKHKKLSEQVTPENARIFDILNSQPNIKGMTEAMLRGGIYPDSVTTDSLKGIRAELNANSDKYGTAGELLYSKVVTEVNKRESELKAGILPDADYQPDHIADANKMVEPNGQKPAPKAEGKVEAAGAVSPFDTDITGKPFKFKPGNYTDENARREHHAMKAVDKNRGIVHKKINEVYEAEKAGDAAKALTAMKEAVELAEKSNIVNDAHTKEFGQYRDGFNIKMMLDKIARMEGKAVATDTAYEAGRKDAVTKQVKPKNEGLFSDHSAAGKDIPFQRSSQSTGLQQSQVQSITDKAVSSIPNAPKVNVVQSNKDCPAEVQKIMEQEGIDDAMGFTWNGEVYLIADNLRNTNEALRTLAHELTHSGLGKFFRRQTKGKIMSVRVKYEALMDAIYRAHGKEIEQIAKTTHTHLNTRTVHGRRQACEEWLCNQTYEAQHKWYDKLVAIFHDLLRAIGLDVKLSDAEVRVVLQDAFKEFGSEGVSFMTAWQGGPYDFNQEVLVESPDGTREYLVGTPDVMPQIPAGYKVIKEFPKGRHRSDKIGTGEGAQAYGYGHYFAGLKEVAEFYKKKLSGKEDPRVLYEPVKAAKAAKVLQSRIDAMYESYEFKDDLDLVWNKVNDWAQDPTYWDFPTYYLEDAGVKYDDVVPEGKQGRLYEVELAPAEDEYLLWDKPLSEQSDKVRKALEKAGVVKSVKTNYTDPEKAMRDFLSTDYAKQFPNDREVKWARMILTDPDYDIQADGREWLDSQMRAGNGSSFYNLLGGSNGAQIYDRLAAGKSQKDASEYLHSLGIRGIKYLDGSSRGKGEGNYNYVIFDESDIEITAKFQRKGLTTPSESDSRYSVTKDKGTGQITAKDNPTPEAELIEEAKKYDSAEEFVNAQNTTETKLLRAQIASDAGKYDRDHWGTMDEIANELPEYKNLMTGMYKEDSFGNKKLPKYDEKTKLIEEAIDDYINKDKKVFIGWDRIQTKTGDTTVPVVYFKTPHGEASFHMVKWGIGYVKGNMVGYNKLLFNIKAEGYEDNLRPMYMQIPKKYEKLFNKDYKWNGEKKTREVLEKNFSETKNQLINIYNKAHSLPNPTPEGSILNNLNPSNGLFANYSPEARATMPLGKNMTTLDKTMGKPADEIVTIYRAAPKEQKEIVPGDYVTTNKQLAQDYAGTGTVIEKKVKLSDVLDDKTEPLGEEYIYRPAKTTPQAEAWKDTSKWEHPEIKARVLDEEDIALGITSEDVINEQKLNLAKQRIADYKPPIKTKFITPENIDEISSALLAAKEGKIGTAELNNVVYKNIPLPDESMQGYGASFVGDLEPGTIKDNIPFYLSEYIKGQGLKGNIEGGVINFDKTPPVPGSYYFRENPNLYDNVIDGFRKNPTKILQDILSDIKVRLAEDEAGQKIFKMYYGEGGEFDPIAIAKRNAEEIQKRRDSFKLIKTELPNPSRPPEVGGPVFSRAPKDPPEKGASVEAINNYLKDETDAAVKVILTKFPEWFEQSWPGQKLKSTLNDPDFKPKRETSWLEALIASPEWLQNPHINKIVRLFMRDRSEISHETFNDLNSMDDINAPESTVTEAAKALRDKGVSFADRVKGKVSKEYALLGRFIDEGDTVWAHMHKDKPMEERINLFKEHMKKNGATDAVLKVWQAMRESYDKALDLQMAQMRQMLAEIMERSAWNKLTDPRMIEMTGKLDKLTAAMNAEKFKTKKAKIQKEINALEKQIDDLAQAIEDTEIGEMRDTLKGALAQMNEWRGFYAPRIREQGAWQILAYKEHGPLKENREWHREHKTSQLAAEKRANQLRREGYKVYNVGKQDRLPEGIYQDVNAVATAKLIDSALEKLANKQGENVAVKINEEVLRAVSDEIKARGFRSHMIHRQEGPVVRGFIEDSIERHILYLNQLSSGIAKAKVAKMAMAELLGERINGEQVGGMNPKDDPRAYEIATNYIREQLRNLDRSDQIIGLAKSIATFKFLGFNLRSLAVNTTAIATTAPTTIHQYALGGKGSMFSIYNAIGKAGKDYGMVMAGKDTNLSGDEKSFIEDFHRKGWDDAQYVRDATGEIMKSHSKVWNFLMDKSMWGFGVSEKWNRGTTMLAAYRLARKQGMDHAQASEAAKNASDKAHGVYGRATLPMWAQGANPAGKVGQMMYVYMKFSHNYLQMLYDVGFRKKNVKGLMFAMLSPIILAGGAAWPFKDELFAFAGAILKLLGEERDPEKWVWDQIRKHVGPTAEKVGRHGLTGAMGVDISGSLSIGVGIPKGLIDLTGAIGGVAGDVKEAGEAVGRGQYGRAAEYLLPTGIANIPRAIRESTQGATTRQNRPVWDEQGKPYKPGTASTVARVAGFRSTEQAVLSERTWEGRREQTRMNNKRKDIYEKYRAWLIGRGSKEDHARIMEDVKKYNKSIENIDGVSKITFKSLRDQARRVSKPSKRERAILSD